MQVTRPFRRHGSTHPGQCARLSRNPHYANPSAGIENHTDHPVCPSKGLTTRETRLAPLRYSRTLAGTVQPHSCPASPLRRRRALPAVRRRGSSALMSAAVSARVRASLHGRGIQKISTPTLQRVQTARVAPPAGTMSVPRAVTPRAAVAPQRQSGLVARARARKNRPDRRKCPQKHRCRVRRSLVSLVGSDGFERLRLRLQVQFDVAELPQQKSMPARGTEIVPAGGMRFCPHIPPL